MAKDLVLSREGSGEPGVLRNPAEPPVSKWVRLQFTRLPSPGPLIVKDQQIISTKPELCLNLGLVYVLETGWHSVNNVFTPDIYVYSSNIFLNKKNCQLLSRIKLACKSKEFV